MPCSAGSMSTWMILASGAKLLILPVMRSSKRAPSVMSRSLFCMAVTAVALPCIPGMPRHNGWLSGNAPRAINVVTTGMFNSSAICFTYAPTPAPSFFHASAPALDSSYSRRLCAIITARRAPPSVASRSVIKPAAWSPLYRRLLLWFCIANVVTLLVSVAVTAAAWFLLRAFRDNPFLSGVVRVQDDRGHHVVSTGVYAVVRHPMYAGMVLMAVGGALLLGSTVGLLSAAFIALVLAARCLREERVLSGQLDGYTAYQSQVRARLIPYLW